MGVNIAAKKEISWLVYALNGDVLENQPFISL